MSDEERFAGAQELIDPHPTDEVCGAIGNVATEWALLEHYIDRTIWAVAGVSPEIGSCLTSQFSSPRPRLVALSALCARRGLYEEIISKINAFSEKVRKLGGQRNRCLHDSWGIGKPSKKTYRLEVTADRKPVLEFKEVDPSTVLELAKKIRAHRFEYNEIDKAIMAALAS
jgi:hypothetical protein